MIVYHKNNEIDREKWDNCIRDSAGAKPYAYSWYLDIMAPGWEALVDDDYDAVFPVPAKSRFGISYIATPVFLQQLGVFSPDKPSDNVINEFLDYMPDIFRYIDLCVAQQIDCKGYTMTIKANYVLDLSSSYEVLYRNFNRNCKRNISFSLKNNLKIVEDIQSDELIRLFMSNKGKEIKGIKQRDYERLENLMNFCISNNKGRILGVRSGNKKLISGLFFIEIKGYKTMIFLVNSPESHEMRAGYYIYNELIRESAGTNTLFDFSGSSIPSIALFMESFGSVKVPYYRICRNRLFWPVRMMK